MLNFEPHTWSGTYWPPPIKDIRWRAFGLLFIYLIMGLTFLGFSRKPLHVFTLIAIGAVLDMVLNGVIKGRKVFPLSAMISCCSLAIILNWSFSWHNLLLPVFVCMASKYIFTLDGRHFFNPSLFAICFCILIGGEYVTLSPSYQWYGSADSAWFMMYFVATAALMLFVFKINRTWLVVSFLITFVLQTIVRGLVMEHIIPFETLFVGSLTSPAFYLFTFYMITDPATSPAKKSEQVLVGISIALLDLVFHLKFSLYTFFFAGFTVAGIRYVYAIFKKWKVVGFKKWTYFSSAGFKKYTFLSLLSIPVFWSFMSNINGNRSVEDKSFTFEQIPAQHSGFYANKGNILEQTDPRVRHVAKWVLSVGDAVAVSDVNLDGLPDVFLTQPLKSQEDAGKLYLNNGGFSFEKIAIPPLERYLADPVNNGVPGFAFFFDFDNDGDKDLFVGFGFGKSHLFENRMIPDDSLSFREVPVPFLQTENTICLAANAMDVNNNGKLDLILTNTLMPYLPGYGKEKIPLNVFQLPQPAHEGDRRMFHFMHESWHNANNGGLNHLLLNSGKPGAFESIPPEQSNLKETRWSLAVGTADINDDGFTDMVIANDFGRDDWYLNNAGKGFLRQEGNFYGDIGLDTYKGMNVSFGDLDGNHKEDVYISNVHHEMQAEGSLLWMNFTEAGKLSLNFKEQAQRFNLLNTNRFGWGAAIGDLNLDGWMDLVQVNGMVDDSWDKQWEEPHNFWYYQAQIARTGPEIHSYADKWADIRGCYIYPNEPDRVSINDKGKGFIDVAKTVGVDHLANTRGVALADFDNDGDLDLVITNQFGEPFLYKNKIQQRQWLGLELIGDGIHTNKDAVGTKVWLSYRLNGKDITQYREQRLVNGFLAMSDNRMLFGLGHENDEISGIEVRVKWHNGEEEKFNLADLNQYLFLTQ